MVVCCIQWGNTHLHHACREGNKEVALLLIEHGADVKAENKVRVVTNDVSTLPLLLLLLLLFLLLLLYIIFSIIVVIYYYIISCGII